MKKENELALERLSLFCHIVGLFSVFIGLVVSFMELLSGNIIRMQTGLYIFITGYALVKISSKIAKVLLSEQHRL